MIRRALVVAIVALVLMATPSDAHLMPEGQGSTHLVGNKAYSLISVPVGVLTGFDDDKNGAISMLESRVHFASIQEQIERRVQLFDDRSIPGRTIYQDLQVPHFDSSSAIQSNAVIQIRVSEWDEAPRALRLRADIFTPKERELQFRAIVGDSTEVATLTASRPEWKFFMGPQANPSAPALWPTAAVLAGLTAALAAAAVLTRRRTQSVASSLSSAA